MGEFNMFERYDELRRKEEAYEAIVAKFGSVENALKAINEEDVLKFYYCESEDKFLVGQRVDTRYYAEVCKTGLNFRWSRHLPWGEHIVAPNTLWKEHTYPSEPKEIDFHDWLKGYIKQIDKAETVDAVPVVPLSEIYRVIAGHSDYHGDRILSALTCIAEGKEVKPIKPLE